MHIERASSGPSMSSLFKALLTTPPLPYMVVLLKPGRVPVGKQPLSCLEPENKLGGGPDSLGVPQSEVLIPDYTQPQTSQVETFSKGVNYDAIHF